MTTQHTQGEWIVQPHKNGWLSIDIHVDGNLIAAAWGKEVENLEEAKANAVLIAAAPKLLKALADLVEAREMNAHLPVNHGCYEDARAAIAAARGK